MRSLAWVVLGLALLAVTRADPVDTDGDGELGEVNSEEEIIVAEGLNTDYRLAHDPTCALLTSTDNQPSKYLLDISAFHVCNDYVNEIWGECNCPTNHACEYEGAVAEDRIYFCRDLGSSPSDMDQYGNGVILGELEYPQVYFVEGADKK